MVSVSLVYKTIMISCDICEQFLSFFFFLPALAELPDYVNFEGGKKKSKIYYSFSLNQGHRASTVKRNLHQQTDLLIFTLAQRSWGLVERFWGISLQRVERFRIAVAAMCAASMSWV